MNSYSDLKVWQVAMDLVEEIYTITNKFPKTELFALSAQLRRSSVSIVMNIAEGFGRYSYADKTYKYTIARGECTETEAGILVAIRLKFISQSEGQRAINLSKEVGRMLSGLVKSCQSRSKRP